MAWNLPAVLRQSGERMCTVVFEAVEVGDCVLGNRAVACPCLCRSVESTSRVFSLIGYDGRVRRAPGFCWCFRSVKSVGRLWRSSIIFERMVGVEVGHSECRVGQQSVKIGGNRSGAGGFGRLDLMLRPSTRRSCRGVSVSRACGEDKETQGLSLLSCRTGAEPWRQAWFIGIQGSQTIGLRIRGFTGKGDRSRGTSDATAWYWYRRSSLGLSHRTSHS